MANFDPGGAPRFVPSGRAHGEQRRGGRGAVKLSRPVHRRLMQWSLASGTPMRELADRAVRELLEREQRRVVRTGKLPWEREASAAAAPGRTRPLTHRWLRRLLHWQRHD